MNTPARTPLTKSPAGTWTILTAKTTEEAPYSGTVQIHPMGKIYTVSWLTTLGDYSGLAFFEDGHLFVGCSLTDAYGITVYTINNDGTLDGQWTTPSSRGAVSIERAVGGTPGELEGSYQITDTIVGVGNYEGTLDIRGLNDFYEVFWSLGVEYKGAGFRVGDKLFVTWGAENVRCLAYEIDDTKAQGRWVNVGESALGMETLQKIC